MVLVGQDTDSLRFLTISKKKNQYLVPNSPQVKHHLRKEKNCLNCGTMVPDRYCTHCGQENTEPKETVGHMIGHFFADITHYDSKFFTTLKDLLFKPGFLTREYFSGKRVRYLHPVRMYIFISLVFFLVLFLRNDEAPEPAGPDLQSLTIARQQLGDSLRQKALTADSAEARTLNTIAASLDSSNVKTAGDEAIAFRLGSKGARFELTENRYNNLHEYDSVQNSLPKEQKDAGPLRWIIRTNVGLKSRYGTRSQVVVSESFQHSVPKMMFILLPLFAFFIKIFHSRKYLYTQHLIFSIHFHSFLFLLLLVNMLLSWLNSWAPLAYVIDISTLLLMFTYFSIALQKTYQQSAGLSFVKALSISLLYIIVLVISLFVLALFIFFMA
jgi:hypothetical protein